jgi:hypothetical protein
MIFAKVKFLTVRVGQFKHAGVLAPFGETVRAERFPGTRMIRDVDGRVSVFGCHHGNAFSTIRGTVSNMSGFGCQDLMP